MWKNFAMDGTDFAVCDFSGVESKCGNRAKPFPQSVQSKTADKRIFHEILHKLCISTPQILPNSTKRKTLHFSGFSPRGSCGRKNPAGAEKKGDFHFSAPSNTTTIFLFVCFVCFHSFAAPSPIKRKMAGPECKKRLSVTEGQWKRCRQNHQRISKRTHFRDVYFDCRRL